MMVRAGSPVDELMEQLFPLLSPGDILIDGGNSNYEEIPTGVSNWPNRKVFFSSVVVCPEGRRGVERCVYHARWFGKSMVGSEADSSEYCSKSTGWYTVLPMGRTSRIGTFCEDDSQRYRIR